LSIIPYQTAKDSTETRNDTHFITLEVLGQA